MAPLDNAASRKDSTRRHNSPHRSPTGSETGQNSRRQAAKVVDAKHSPSGTGIHPISPKSACRAEGLPCTHGVRPRSNWRNQNGQRFPRVHGDRPSGAPDPTTCLPGSPHARGSSDLVQHRLDGNRGSPTARGSTSFTTRCLALIGRFPARSGLHQKHPAVGGTIGVFAARTGLSPGQDRPAGTPVPRLRGGSPIRMRGKANRRSVPRTRGDDPVRWAPQPRGTESAPHARGSTRASRHSRGHTLDSPARTGNDLIDKLCACLE